RGLARVAASLVLHPGRLNDEELGRLVAEDHPREHVLDELTPPDRLAERLPLARVPHGLLEAGTDHPACARSDGEAPLIEPVHRDLEPLPLVPDEILSRDLDVREEQLTGR